VLEGFWVASVGDGSCARVHASILACFPRHNEEKAPVAVVNQLTELATSKLMSFAGPTMVHLVTVAKSWVEAMYIIIYINNLYLYYFYFKNII